MATRIEPTFGILKVKAAATGNLTLSGAQTIDGVACVAGDLVLAHQQSTGAEKGVYVVKASAWTLVDPGPSDGLLIEVLEGSTLGEKTYKVTNAITWGSGTPTFEDQTGGTSGGMVTLTGTQTLTNKTLTAPTINGGVLVLPTATTPAQTAAGSVVWDSDDNLLTVGDGSTRKVMVDTGATQTLTNKTLTAPAVNNPAVGGQTPPSAAVDVVKLHTADINGAGTAGMGMVFEGGATLNQRVNAAGVLNVMEISESVADDGTISLPAPTAGRTGILEIMADTGEYGKVRIGSDASVNSLQAGVDLESDEFAKTDTDNKLCVFDAGTTVTIRNRLGGARWLMGTYKWS